MVLYSCPELRTLHRGKNSDPAFSARPEFWYVYVGESVHDLALGDMVLLRIAGEEEGQGAVAGDVAGGAEAVLQGKDRKHQRRADTVDQEHTALIGVM